MAFSTLPNLHPALVHFPLALLPLAVLFDLLAVILARRWLDRIAVLLYGVGVAIGWWAAEAGEEAAESFLDLPAAIEPAIAKHSDMAHYALYTFAAVLAVRLILVFRDRSVEMLRARGFRSVVLLATVAGLFFLFETAEHGGGLVYGHGLGVSPDALMFAAAQPDLGAQAEPAAPAQQPAATAESVLAADPAARSVRGDDGSLVWTPIRSDAGALGSILFPVAGFAGGAIEVVPSAAAGDGLDLAVLDRGMLVFAPSFRDVRVEAELVLDDFVGTVGVAHHVVSAESASWFELSASGGVALKLAQAGAVLTLEEADLSVMKVAGEPVRLAVSSTGRHRKGMVNGEAVVHGHIDAAAEAGQVGLLLDGRGRLRVLRVTVEPL